MKRYFLLIFITFTIPIDFILWNLFMAQTHGSHSWDSVVQDHINMVNSTLKGG